MVRANAVMESESALTDRYQTTVPEPVRRALNLQKRDRIRYEVMSDGTVTMSKAVEDGDDEVVGQFLDLLAKDIAKHPERLHVMDSGFTEYLLELVADVEIDLDKPLDPDDE